MTLNYAKEIFSKTLAFYKTKSVSGSMDQPVYTTWMHIVHKTGGFPNRSDTTPDSLYRCWDRYVKIYTTHRVRRILSFNRI